MAKDEDSLLRSVTRWRVKPKRSIAKIGHEANLLMINRGNALSKNAEVVNIWESLLPDTLLGHCQINKIKGGVLNIKVKPGVHMYEFKMMKAEFLDRLLEECPKCGIRQITLSV